MDKSVNMPNDGSFSATPAMKTLVNILNNQLADTIDLRSQIRQADFNVHSPYAEELRELFEGLAQDFQKIADTIALAIRELGGLATGTVRLVAPETNLPNYPLDAYDATDHLKALLTNHSRYALDTRKNVRAVQESGDAEIEKLLVTILHAIESNLWLLEAYLEGIAVGNSAANLPRWISAFEGSLRHGSSNTIPPTSD